MRVVYDTNVVVSAVLYDRKPLKALNRCMLGGNTAVTSPVLLAEYADILARKFHVPHSALVAFVQSYEHNCEIIVPTQSLQVLADEADNRVLEAAHEGQCGYIVTGDKKLLELGEYGSVKIVSVDGFLSIVA